MTIAAKMKRSFSVDKVQKEYARVAWFYDGWGRLTEDRALQRLLQLAEVRDGSHILDVGVGTGRLFGQVVRENPGGVNVGVDLSPAMLKHARKRLAGMAAPGSWELQEGSAYELPFADASFDLLFSTFMLDMLPEEDYPRLLGEFRRVLKPGGRLCLAAFSFGTRPIHRLWYWLAKHFPSLLTQCRPVHLEPALRNAGFEIAHQEEVSQFTFPSQLILARRENDHGRSEINPH
jgi:ubiquinone/menaquinone biosynthesis C-methylase UbiE